MSHSPWDEKESDMTERLTQRRYKSLPKKVQEFCSPVLSLLSLKANTFTGKTQRGLSKLPQSFLNHCEQPMLLPGKVTPG